MHMLRKIKFMHIRQLSKEPSKLFYEIPERYQNAFYLANASFFDSTNWFLHKAYETVFPMLKNELKSIGKNQEDDLKTHLKLENIIEILDQCNSVIDVRFPIKRNNGRYEMVRGFKAQFGQMLGSGTCMGGLRFSETITRDHMKALSVLATYRNACMGIGMAGAHGSIKIDPKKYHESELKNIVELYVKQLYKKGYCNVEDVTCPDINTSEREINWVLNSLEQVSGQVSQASVCGKHEQHGGIEEFKKMAAVGASRALDFFLEDDKLMSKIGLSKGIQNKRFIIQGLGKVGKNLAQMLVKKGATCVGVQEKEAYIYDKNGISLQDLLDYRAQSGTIENFGLSKTENFNSIFTEDADILIFAACHKSLSCYVAKDVRVKIVLEASDGPLTPSAHKILTDKSRLVIPDIFALGGISIASYFEYLRSLHHSGILEENVFNFSNDIYKKIFKNICQDSQQLTTAIGSTVIYNTGSEILLCLNTLKHIIDSILTPIGEEMLKNLEDHKLGTDLRTAAYGVAIRNSFRNIFVHKRFF